MDYADLFINSALMATTPATVISLIFLTVARIVPVIALAPFFGARVLPHPVKVVLSICLLTMVLPKLMMDVKEPIPFNATLVFLFAKELFIGFILGFFVSIPFFIVSSSGLIIDHQRGAASLMTNDPTIQNQSSPIGTLLNLVLICLFFTHGGPFLVIDTLLSSYDLVPPDKFLSSFFFLTESPLHVRIVDALQVFVEVMLKFAMPGLLVILMTDTFLGIINRLAPQVQITFLGMGLKSWLAIFIVCVGWSPLVDQMSKEIIVWLRQFMQLVQELAVGMPH